jgi:hypothetical protein
MKDTFFDTDKKTLSLRPVPHKESLRVHIIRSLSEWKKRNRTWVPALVFLGILSITIVVAVQKSHAEIISFYPTSCLGGWKNPSNAQGKPDITGNYDPKLFTDGNSALLQNSQAELFCGGFKGEIPQSSKPTNITVSFNWSIEDGSIVHQNVEPFPAPDATTPQGAVPVTPDPAPSLPSDVTSPADSSVPGENSLQTFLFSPQIAYAEESAPTDTPPVVSPNVPPQDQTAITPVVVPAVDMSTADTTTAPATDVSTTTISEPPTPITDPILEVSYTLDGTTWQKLGVVDRNYWNNKSFTIPLVAWADLSLLQISVKPLQTVDNPPTVYLDSMHLDIEYIHDESPKFYSSDEKKYLFQSVTSTDDTVFHGQISHDDNQGDVIILNSMVPGSVDFYDTEGTMPVIETAIGSDPLSMPAFNFKQGHGSVVLTKNPNGCGGKPLAQCIVDKSFTAKIDFTIVPSSDTPAMYISTDTPVSNDIPSSQLP